MKVNIIAVGNIKEKFLKEGILEYQKRMNAFGSLNIIEIKEKRIADENNKSLIDKALDEEAEAILKYVKGNIIVLDIDGDIVSSEDFSNIISECERESAEASFIIGSSFGLASKVKNIAKYRISFGKVTYPHMLMRLILSEQIYRAFMIKANRSYHK